MTWKSSIRRVVPPGLLRRLRGEQHNSSVPPLGAIDFGSLRRTTPISRQFGFDRGTPIDRYYIAKFLAEHANDIRGRVLEIGDDAYTRQFGAARVQHSDILHVTAGNPRATIIADITNAPHIPAASFDCIIFPQTLHLIYDVRAAIATLYRILKPGGSVLATFPGISQKSTDEWGTYWQWAFTRSSGERIFGEVFPASSVTTRAYGNVLAAIAFLHGIVTEELTSEELDVHDTAYEMLIGVRAVKPNAERV
jgi:SAM-dependent methyltransferase